MISGLAYVFGRHPNIQTVCLKHTIATTIHHQTHWVKYTIHNSNWLYCYCKHGSNFYYCLRNCILSTDISRVCVSRMDQDTYSFLWNGHGDLVCVFPRRLRFLRLVVGRSGKQLWRKFCLCMYVDYFLYLFNLLTEFLTLTVYRGTEMQLHEY